MQNKNLNKKSKKMFKNKKDCCMQSLKEVNCFLSDFSNIKKAINIFKWLKK